MKSKDIKFDMPVFPKDIQPGQEIAYRVYQTGAVIVAHVVEARRNTGRAAVIVKTDKAVSLWEDNGRMTGRLMGGSAEFLVVENGWGVWTVKAGTVDQIYGDLREYLFAMKALERGQDLQKNIGYAAEPKIAEVEQICKDIADNMCGYRVGVESVAAFLTHPKLEMKVRW
jgi:hypothetical protein